MQSDKVGGGGPGGGGSVSTSVNFVIGPRIDNGFTPSSPTDVWHDRSYLLPTTIPSWTPPYIFVKKADGSDLDVDENGFITLSPDEGYLIGCGSECDTNGDGEGDTVTIEADINPAV